jgi:hypothetical protein
MRVSPPKHPDNPLSTASLLASQIRHKAPFKDRQKPSEQRSQITRIFGRLSSVQAVTGSPLHAPNPHISPGGVGHR